MEVRPTGVYLYVRFTSLVLYRLDVGRSGIVYDRMRKAISQLNYDPAHAEAMEIHAKDRELILQGTYLRDILLRSFAPEDHEAEEDVDDPFDYINYMEEEELPPRVDGEDEPAAALTLDGLFRLDSHIQSWARRYSQPNPVVVEGDPLLEGLNSTQVRAVAMMLDNRFTLVQGVCIRHLINIIRMFTDTLFTATRDW